MALLFIEGFDAYSSETHLVGKWDKVGTTGSTTFVSGVYGGNAMRSTGAATLEKILGADYSTLVCGFRFKTETTMDSGEKVLVFHRTVPSDQLYVEATATANQWQVRNGNNDSLGTFTVPENENFYFEIKATFHITAGAVIVKIDGSEVLNVSGVRTVDAGTPVNAVNFLRFHPGHVGETTVVDDFYLLDTTGSVANDFLGDSYVETLFPTGDNSVAWSRSAGTTNYENVDEDAPDDATTYVHDTTATDVDRYDFGNLASGATDVYGVQVNARHWRADSGVRLVKLLTKSGVNEQASPEHQMYMTWTASYQLFTTKDGSTQWSPSDVDGAQFGIELV